MIIFPKILCRLSLIGEKVIIGFLTLPLLASCDWKSLDDASLGKSRLSGDYYLQTTDNNQYWIGHDGADKESSEYRGVGSWVIGFYVTNNSIYAVQMQSSVRPTSIEFTRDSDYTCLFHKIDIEKVSQVVQLKDDWVNSIKKENGKFDFGKDFERTSKYKNFSYCYAEASF